MVIQVHVAREMIHPCQKLSIAPECVPVFQHPEEHLLHHVFTEMPIPRQPEVIIEQLQMMSVEQMGELAYVAAPDVIHQFDVGR